ncbi:hypothetical protein [Nocardia callitridis]|uniref:Asp23/Gls24 family envelope stress response protein n=1 Tax=Nocardia callitridis TaxID=648753 RepID=A0ABP9KJU4_9NOCA
MSADGVALQALIEAIEGIDGVRLAVPLGAKAPDWWPWDARGFAVDLAPESVEVRVVAQTLPLAPLLEKTTAQLRAALLDTRWADAVLRVVVADLDAVAFDRKHGC